MWHSTFRDGVHLACGDHGGEGPAAVLVHGLAGHAGEWDGTAAWLGRTHRVVAPDARGHGRSERRPGDVSRTACVDDLAHWIELLGLAPALVIGQSLGGHTAFLLAARPSPPWSRQARRTPSREVTRHTRPPYASR